MQVFSLKPRLLQREGAVTHWAANSEFKKAKNWHNSLKTALRFPIPLQIRSWNPQERTTEERRNVSEFIFHIQKVFSPSRR